MEYIEIITKIIVFNIYSAGHVEIQDLWLYLNVDLNT